MEKIVYNYVDRKELHSSLMFELLEKLYSISYPKPEKSFEELAKDSKKFGKWSYPIDFYYVPQKVQREIVDDFFEKHNIKLYWKDNMEFLIDILFNKGGIKEVYGTTDWSKEPLRHCIDIPTLDKIIPKEYSDKVKEVLEGYLNTYRFGTREYNSLNWSVINYSPTTARDYIKQAWKEAFDKDIELPNDDTWVDEYYEDE